MRRTFVLALAALALLGVVVPGALAQAPTPTFRINGLIDQVGSYSRNMSSTTNSADFNMARNNDTLFYGRTRGRFDFIGEYGKTKAVLGIEIDSTWGQTGSVDSNNTTGCGVSSAGSVQCAPGFGTTESGFDINTDTQGNLQIKWLYTEFEVPFIPVPTVVRLGGQPFGSAASYKLAYANGDFGGVNIVSTITPNLRVQFTYVALEELMTGKKDNPNTASIVPGTTIVNSRGDDLAFIISPEITPMKGLDIKPFYSYLFAVGTTSGSTRLARGGYAIGQGGPFAPATISGADSVGTGMHENRHTVGLDARFRSGPFSLDPTVMYQFGNRNTANTVSSAYGILCNTTSTASLNCAKDKADISAWLVDVRGGYQLGPLLLELAFNWSSGNRAQDTLRKNVNFYQPLDTDTGYMADFGTQIFNLNLDYGQSLGPSGASLGNLIGYDKYGRVQLAGRATYALTPTLSASLVSSILWTDKSVDTDSTLSNGLLPAFVDRTTGKSARPEGESRYMGTELDALASWRFAPGISFDWSIGYLFAGAALAHRHPAAVYCEAGKVNAANCQPPDQKDGKANDAFITSARIRFTF